MDSLTQPALEPPQGLFVAILGDIVSSRQLGGARRMYLQRAFRELLADLDHAFAPALVAKFTITTGDEFEGLIHASSASEVVPDLIWRVEEALATIALRFGIGMGSLDTDIVEDVHSIDGPAFHAAREAIEIAARKSILGGVFRGFGEEHDAILGGIAGVLHHHRFRWSRQQRRLANLLRRGMRKTEAAGQLKISKQAVSMYARAAGWDAYAAGEVAWRMAIAESTRKCPPPPQAV
jgi:hypothetical protein